MTISYLEMLFCGCSRPSGRTAISQTRTRTYRESGKGAGHFKGEGYSNSWLKPRQDYATTSRETGSEREAANYIDNFVSQKNGRFIAPWEPAPLKAFITHVRNPHGHGAGSQPPPNLADCQTNWAIETAMSWIKSLTRRP
jgi:hypothetical protein